MNMAHTTGQILDDRYRIVKRLAEGGFGAVYRAWDTNLDRPCAIKENLVLSPEARRQFLREAQLLSNLSHPNLPRVTDHFEIPDSGQYLVMDFVEGQDLAEMLDRNHGPLPVDQALNWISQVCDALVYLHTQDPPIVHRDIKPANIKITPSGQAVLVDFGIAKIFDPDQATTLGARAVTPGYSPPEQYGQRATDTYSDIYSLGATAYSMLTGLEPPASVDVLAGIAAPPAPVHLVNPDVPAEVSSVIKRAIQLNRQERQADAREFSEELAAAMTAKSDVATVGLESAGAAMAAAAVAGRETTELPEVQPTQVVSDIPSEPVPSQAAPPYAPAYGPPSAPPAEQKRRFPCAWIAAIAALVLIIGGLAVALGVVLYMNNRDDTANQEKTQTAEALVLLVSDTPTSAPSDTPLPTSPPASATPVPTDTPIPTDTLVPTETLPPLPAEIINWDMENFIETEDNCHFTDMACWLGTSGDKILTSVESYYIDPSWSNPQLAFWHRYDIPGEVSADVSIGVSGYWTPVTYFKGSSNWKQTVLSLEEYVGETIEIRFHMPFGTYRTKVKCEKILGITYDCYEVQETIDSEWTIQRIEIVPDEADLR
jgi:serine/threonine protein kinase